jgi:putative nucleotidyltransferase with HDIG domain
MIPTIEECFQLMDQYKMLENIRRHSLVVEKIAGLITHGLIEAGFPLSMEKVTAGALLHDIAKTICLREGCDHSLVGEEICLKNQLDEIADLVGEHVRLKQFDPKGDILEKEIIYYADKRVTHDQIVTIKERLKDLFVRYGKGNVALEKRMEENFRICLRVEQKLFAELPFGPDDIPDLLNKDIL